MVSSGPSVGKVDSEAMFESGSHIGLGEQVDGHGRLPLHYAAMNTDATVTESALACSYVAGIVA